MSIFALVLFMAFVLFDLTGVVDWSPVWIAAPLWVYLILLVCTLAEQALMHGLKEKK